MSHQPDALAALHALDALPPVERARFEAHLLDCQLCRDELDSMRQIAAEMSPDVEAPARVWQRITRHIGIDSGVVVELKVRKTWQRMVSVAAAAAIFFTGWSAGAWTRSPSISEAAEVASSSPGSMSVDLVVDDHAVAHLILTADGSGYMIPTDGLEPLDSDRTYQLWVVNSDDQVISAGVFGPSPGPVAFTWNADVTAFVLTREVAGGVSVSEGDVVSATGEI